MTKLEPWAVATARAAIENGKARDSGKVHVGLPFSEKVMHHLGMTENMKQPPTKLEQIWLHKPRTMGIQRIRLLGGELKKQRPRFDWERRVNNAGKRPRAPILSLSSARVQQKYRNKRQDSLLAPQRLKGQASKVSKLHRLCLF